MSNSPHVIAVSADAPYAVTLEDHTGHRWLADEPAEAGGGATGPIPQHLLLSALGACTAITVRMYAAHKGWPLSGVEVEVVFNPDGKPTDGSNELRRRVTLLGELSEEQRQHLIEVASKCPIHRILSSPVRLPILLDPV